MPNMKQILSRHNAKVAYSDMPQPPPGCNCRGGGLSAHWMGLAWQRELYMKQKWQGWTTTNRNFTQESQWAPSNADTTAIVTTSDTGASDPAPASANMCGTWKTWTSLTTSSGRSLPGAGGLTQPPGLAKHVWRKNTLSCSGQRGPLLMPEVNFIPPADTDWNCYLAILSPKFSFKYRTTHYLAM